MITFFVLLFSFTQRSYAADFQTAYQVDYHLSQQADSLNSKVDFSIAITNLRSDVYVNKFSISFPKAFAISDLTSYDDNGPVAPIVSQEGDKSTVTLIFNDPKVGKGSVNNFYLTFDQSNLFKINGNTWEVILPVIENKDNSTYKVNVYLPEGTTKKISIAKPKPDLIEGNKIVWNNPTTRTIYAVFGNSQLYDVNLTYHLKNPSLAPSMMEVAFPPDTLYQKIYVNSLSQPPTRVYLDDDGNYMGVYYLNPLETKVIKSDFTIQVFPQPRQEVVSWSNHLFEKDKSYLLRQQPYWTITSLNKIANLNTVSDIYSYEVANLSYDYARLNSDNTRLGAELVLEKPNLAVCTEFTDLFVAASREKGIYAREIEGYGYSSDQSLRPISLSSDILHAWPEYYDTGEKIWKPVDPTWQNTSGIDYFSSFDLNHITFVIHGEKSNYPLPAGMYKTGNTKDVQVTAESQLPAEKDNLKIDGLDIVKNIDDVTEYHGNLTIENQGNVYLWNTTLTFAGNNIKLNPPASTILTLPPGGKKVVNFTYRAAHENSRETATLVIALNGQKYGDYQLSIFPHLFSWIIKAVSALLIAVLVVLISTKVRKKFL